MLKYYLYSLENDAKELTLKRKDLKYIPFKVSFLVTTEKDYKVYLCNKLKTGTIVYTDVFDSFIDFEQHIRGIEQ